MKIYFLERRITSKLEGTKSPDERSKQNLLKRALTFEITATCQLKEEKLKVSINWLID